MNSIQIKKQTRAEIEKMNAEASVRQNTNLQNEMDFFVQEVSILCGIDIKLEHLNLVSKEIVNYLKTYKKNVTFNEFCKIVKQGIYEKEHVGKFSIQLFIGTFEKHMDENKHFKSVAVFMPPQNDYNPPQVDYKSEANKMYFDYCAGKLSELEVEFRLPNIYPYLRKIGKCNFTEAEKKRILGDNYISETEAENALKIMDKKTIVQFNKNKGWLVFEQFKITKNEKNDKKGLLTI